MNCCRKKTVRHGWITEKGVCHLPRGTESDGWTLNSFQHSQWGNSSVPWDFSEMWTLVKWKYMISCREPRVQPFHITLTNFIKLSKVDTNYLKLNKCKIYFLLTSCGAPQLWVRCCRRCSKIYYNIKLTPTHPPQSHVSRTQLSIMTLCLVFAASKNKFKPNWSKIRARWQLPKTTETIFLTDLV